MAVTRINNNQISDASAGNAYVGINAATKIQPYSITATKIANNLTYGSDLTVTGNLTVQGNTTTIDTTYTTIEDPILLLASNQTGSPSVDIGFVGERGTSDNIAFVWDESADEFVTAFTTSGETNTTITISAYASLKTLDTTVTGNLSTAGFATVVGNITGGNLNSNAQVVATGNITGGNLITAGLISATGNINGGNLNATTGIRAATGFFTGNVDVLGNLNASIGVVYANSGIFYGNAVTGNSAIFAGLPGFTALGSNVVAQFAGNANSYSQINFENTSNGTSASTDYIATADNGSDTTYYLDMGINSSQFNDQVNYPGFGPNDSYVHNHGGNLILNPESAGKTIKLMVGGTGNSDVVANVSTTGIDVTGVVSASGNVSGGNLTTAGQAVATGNVTGGNINTAGQVVATGNVTGGNLVTGGRVVATGNIVSSANIAGGNLTITSAINTDTLNTTGNAVIAGNLFVLGNITYNNVNDLRIEDPVIILGTGPNGAPLTSPDSYDRGTFMEYYTSARGNAWVGWQNSSGNMIAAADVSFSGNDIIQVNAYGTFQAGNIYAQSAVSTGNITGGNLITGGLASVTGNITGGNLITGGLGSFGTTVTAAGNITGGNLNTGGQVVSTGNITGGNVNTAGQVVATGNITGGNLNTPNLVSSATVIATGNITGGNLITGGLGSFGTTVTATGNITGGNLNTGAQVVATGNVTGGNLNTAGQVVATGNITGGNLITAGSGTFGNITISDSNVNSTAGRITINSADADVDFAVDGDTTANVLYVDAGTGTVSIGSSTQTTNAALAINATNSFLMPVGNTAQRPGTGVIGMLRFNSTLDAVEVYDSDSWTTVGTPSFTVVSDDQFNGDGANTAFVLSNAYTTNSVIVSINGVVQIPTLAYSVTGNALTFTEAPESGDLIDVRGITTTTQVTAISNSPGNAVVQPNATSAIVEITGDLNPTANVTYNLGSTSSRWKDLYLSGSSITLGNTVIKNVAGGNSIGFFGPDGTTPATIAASSVDTTTIANGTSNVSVTSSGGNVRVNVGGTSNVMVVSSTVVAITGDLSVTGNATLSGNILGDRVQNGTTSIDIQTPSGNANISVGGTSNVAVFSTTGANITGILGVTGNIVSTGSNGVANIGSATTYFNTVHAKATSAQYADLAEVYVADSHYEPGTVVSFGGDAEITISSTENDRRVAGVVSTNPSYLMNSTQEGDNVAPVALQGRVPCRVVGQVRKGDLMVSAGNGAAMANNNAAVGTVIGKALANFDGVEGIIEVVVGRV